MTNTPRIDWRESAALAGVILLAAALRLAGLRWGLPDSIHAYSYHPDEFLTIGAAFSSVYLGRSFDPHFYNYPSLYIYLSALAMAVGIGYGLIGGGDGVYLAARLVTVMMGVGAVAATYWAGEEMFGKTAGLLAALVLAIAPLHVQHSHFATVDVPSTLFVALALGYCARIMKYSDWRDYILAGAMAGLATGTKYNAVLVIFSVIAAHFLRDGVRWPSIRSTKLWVSLGCVIAAFVISTPGCVLRTTEFLHGLKYEMAHTSTGHGLVFAGTGNGFIYTFTSSFWYGLGPLLAILMLISLVGAVIKRDRMTLVVLAFALPYYVLISLSQVRFARYTLLMFPAVALMIGWFCQWILTRGTAAKRRIWAALGIAFFALALICPLVIDRLFLVSDLRDVAARWIFRNVPKKSSIGMIDLPWFYSPPLSKEFGFGTVIQREKAVASTPYDIIVFSQCGRPGGWWSEKTAPDWVVVTDYEVDDALRLRGNDHISMQQQRNVRRILTDYDLVRKHYIVRKRFANHLMFHGLGFGDTRRLPHDMRYVSPTITIYERAK
ncbi:MAG: glycosyltransferase family 39 protein [Armatimonadota bacterium]|nr:glycosyltransferase family 39 protein [bacterium]